jgi:glycosyltransferase involved in cell wall biosynthesis
VLVTDAEVIRRHYLDHYGAESTPIAYGVDPEPLPAGETLARLGLESRRYFLYVSRFEPENNPHRVAEAYRDVPGDLPLVMVGGAPYASSFIDSFTRDADPRIVFPGFVYGEGYRELLSHATAYIQATEVGGTHPALVEAMGYGNCIVANDAPENREVAGPDALYFEAHRPETLAGILTRLLEPGLAASLRPKFADRAARLYTWDRVREQYEEMFLAMDQSRRSD